MTDVCLASPEDRIIEKYRKQWLELLSSSGTHGSTLDKILQTKTPIDIIAKDGFPTNKVLAQRLRNFALLQMADILDAEEDDREMGRSYTRPNYVSRTNAWRKAKDSVAERKDFDIIRKHIIAFYEAKP